MGLALVAQNIEMETMKRLSSYFVDYLNMWVQIDFEPLPGQEKGHVGQTSG